MDTLVSRVRQLIGAEEDDHFLDEEIASRLNHAVEWVVSILVSREIQAGGGIRALDGLRSSQNINSTTNAVHIDGVRKLGYTLTPMRIIYSVSNLFTGNTVPRISREILPSQEMRFASGGIGPTLFESYHRVESRTSLVIYARTSQTSPVSAVVTGVVDPTPVDEASISLNQLPERLELAVLAHAGFLLSVKEEAQRREDLYKLAENQILLNAY